MMAIFKRPFVLAAVLCAVGLVLGGLGLSMLGFDVLKLDNAVYLTNTHEVKATFEAIEIESDTADIRFLPAEDGVCRVVCFEREREVHRVWVEKNTLHIEIEDERRWFDHIGLFLRSTTVTVYLPEESYRSLDVETDTGDVTVTGGFIFETASLETDTGNISLSSAVTGSIEISADTGDVSLKDQALSLMDVDTDTGSISLSNCVATKTIILSCSTGNISLDQVDAPFLKLRTSTGNIKGTLLTGKTFVAKSSTGRVSVPEDSEGGRCEVSTSTGDIRLSLYQEKE